MKVADQKNFAAGLFYIILGAATAFAASRYPLGSASRMGPGYFPLGVGLVLVLTGLVVLAGSLAKGASAASVGPLALKTMAIVMAAVVLFGLLLEPLGLLCAIPVLIGVSALAHHDFSWRTTIMSIIILIPLVWLIFIKVLELPLPLLPSFLAS